MIFFSAGDAPWKETSLVKTLVFFKKVGSRTEKAVADLTDLKENFRQLPLNSVFAANASGAEKGT